MLIVLETLAVIGVLYGSFWFGRWFQYRRFKAAVEICTRLSLEDAAEFEAMLAADEQPEARVH